MPQRNSEETLDALIIGAGPAGIAVAHTLQQAGLRCRIYERTAIAGHIAEYPNFMRFFSTNQNLEIADFPLGITEEKPTRRDYLKYLTDFVQYHRLDVKTYSPVEKVNKNEDGSFDVTVNRRGHERLVVKARTVIVAVGAWEAPRVLDVPGGDLPKVHYRYRETHDYVGQKVLVVGGRNSAVETALQLWRAGVDVSLSYRRTEFGGVGLKYWLRPDIENRLKNGEIKGYLGSQVRCIDWDTVEIETPNGMVTIENDFVLPMLGYEPPVEFLRSLGVNLEPETNRPDHDPETLESNVPGMFICGVITYGNVSGHVFIENSRHHGEMMLERVKDIVSSVPR